MSRGQTQLLNAALRNRQRALEEKQYRQQQGLEAIQADEHVVEETVTPLDAETLDAEDNEPVAVPVSTVEDLDHQLVEKLVEANIIPVTPEAVLPRHQSKQIKDDRDNSNRAGPVPEVDKKGKNESRPTRSKDKVKLLTKTSLQEMLSLSFEKVQVGEEAIILSNPKPHLASMDDQSIIDNIKTTFTACDINVIVVKGSREGRYRAATI